jgi:Cu/Zn superoxide dismutase
MHYAFSKIQPNPELEESQCSGNVKMYQSGEDPVMLRFSLKGLTPGGHVFAVHEGDSIEGGCSAAGAPLMAEGTYTVLVADDDGAVVLDTTNPVLNIIKDQEIDGKINVLGRAVVIHENDDISSGSAGNRLCCGTIDYVEEVPED